MPLGRYPMLSFVGLLGLFVLRHRSLQVTAQTDQIVREGDVPGIADQRLRRGAAGASAARRRARSPVAVSPEAGGKPWTVGTDRRHSSRPLSKSEGPAPAKQSACGKEIVAGRRRTDRKPGHRKARGCATAANTGTMPNVRPNKKQRRFDAG